MFWFMARARDFLKKEVKHRRAGGRMQAEAASRAG
jgi:hypothetical protein